MQTLQNCVTNQKNSCDAMSDLLTVHCKIVLHAGVSEASVISDVENTFLDTF